MAETWELSDKKWVESCSRCKNERRVFKRQKKKERKGKRKKFRRVPWKSLITTLDFYANNSKWTDGGGEGRRNDDVSFHSQWSRNVMDRTSSVDRPYLLQLTSESYSFIIFFLDLESSDGRHLFEAFVHRKFEFEVVIKKC